MWEVPHLVVFPSKKVVVVVMVAVLMAFFVFDWDPLEALWAGLWHQILEFLVVQPWTLLAQERRGLKMSKLKFYIKKWFNS